MSNDDKKVDEVHETTSEEPIENEAHEEIAEFEDTINKISEKDIYKDVDLKNKKFKIGLIAGIIVLIAIIGGVLYWRTSNTTRVTR